MRSTSFRADPPARAQFALGRCADARITTQGEASANRRAHLECLSGESSPPLSLPNRRRSILMSNQLGNHFLASARQTGASSQRPDIKFARLIARERSRTASRYALLSLASGSLALFVDSSVDMTRLAQAASAGDEAAAKALLHAAEDDVCGLALRSCSRTLARFVTESSVRTWVWRIAARHPSRVCRGRRESVSFELLHERLTTTAAKKLSQRPDPQGERAHARTPFALYRRKAALPRPRATHRVRARPKRAARRAAVCARR